jgi:hypothetical protein
MDVCTANSLSVVLAKLLNFESNVYAVMTAKRLKRRPTDAGDAAVQIVVGGIVDRCLRLLWIRAGSVELASAAGAQ